MALTTSSGSAWSPDHHSFNPGDVIPDALILQTSTVVGNVEGDAPAVRVAYVDDAAATFTAEGGDITPVDPTLSEALVYTGKVSTLVRLSREQWLQDGTNENLAASVRRAVTVKANEAYVAQAAPVSPAVSPAAGLLNVSGIEAGGAVADNLDELIDLIATLEAAGSQPSHILIDPVGWASLRKFKTATGSAQSLLGAGSTDSARTLLDVPVLVTPAMSAGTGLVVDKSAVVSAVGQVLVAQSEHAYFGSDSIGLRCTFRFGQNVVRPDRIGKFTVTAPVAE